jgi:hypothetical protein
VKSGIPKSLEGEFATVLLKQEYFSKNISAKIEDGYVDWMYTAVARPLA